MMGKPQNILFIMFDQLRFDYLGCTGHPFLKTPNIDWLASKSVRFDHCYVQSPVCGASRMSFYTGRYVSSHGAAWNGVPLKVGELTLGDHLRATGMDAFLIGKTHMFVDSAGMARLGLAADSMIGARVSECGFDAVIRDDGLWTEGPDGPYSELESPYNRFLTARGYAGENPWHDYANSGMDAAHNIATGMNYRNSALPANIREEDSETPWLTRAAIDFMKGRAESAPDRPFLCHLSYIKPHWPYIVPAPYHDMYGHNSFVPVKRHAEERKNPHPVYHAFMTNVIGKAFHDTTIRDSVLGAYMGLIRQIDDQMGILFSWLEKTGQLDHTMVILTSDHGDYLGDHWLGEKDLFHAPSVKVPLIVYDPSQEANATRGTVSDALVESIDIAATCIDFAGGKVPDHIVEGRSLMPFLRGRPPARWRDFVVSEYDYSMSPIADRLNVSAKDARLFMIADHHTKMIHAEGGFPPMLFDLKNDPDEFFDRGTDPQYAAVIEKCHDRLSAWARRCAQRTTLSDTQLVAMRGGSSRRGVVLGLADDDAVDPELIARFHGPAQQNHLTGKDAQSDTDVSPDDT